MTNRRRIDVIDSLHITPRRQFVGACLHDVRHITRCHFKVELQAEHS